jgi:hypothetical protein
MHSKHYQEVLQGFQDTKEMAIRGLEYVRISLKLGFLNFRKDHQFTTATGPQGKGER